MALLEGKTALLTGGSTGIGLATAKRFVEEGAYVFINGRSQAELDAAVKEIGENVTGVQGDGSKPGDRDRLYAAVADTGRRLDVVFANAAVIDVARIGEVTQEHLQKALPLLNDGGSIILNSSNPNAKGNDGIGVYAAIKAALRSLASTWASELRDRKIRVDVISPGATEANVGAVVNMSQSASRREAQYYGPREHWIAERLLDRTPIMTTHLRPTLFADWLSWQWVRHENQGVLRLPFGNARHAPIASTDQARVIAAILANPAPHDRQVYPLYGPEELDHDTIAQKMSQALGIPVRYEPVDIESFAAAMRAQGASPFLAQYLSNVGRDYQNSGVFAGTNNLVEVIGGTPPMTVEQYTTATRTSFESQGQHAAWASVA